MFSIWKGTVQKPVKAINRRFHDSSTIERLKRRSTSTFAGGINEVRMEERGGTRVALSQLSPLERFSRGGWGGKESGRKRRRRRQSNSLYGSPIVSNDLSDH